jgi:hypothetical protein
MIIEEVEQEQENENQLNIPSITIEENVNGDSSAASDI